MCREEERGTTWCAIRSSGTLYALDEYRNERHPTSMMLASAKGDDEVQGPPVRASFTLFLPVPWTSA